MFLSIQTLYNSSAMQIWFYADQLSAKPLWNAAQGRKKRKGTAENKCSRYIMDECRCELCELDLLSDSASLSCTRIRFMAFQANDLDLYIGSRQTGEHLDIARNAQRCGYHLVSRLSSG